MAEMDLQEVISMNPEDLIKAVRLFLSKDSSLSIVSKIEDLMIPDDHSSEM